MYRSFFIRVVSQLFWLNGLGIGFAQGQQIVTGPNYTLLIKPDGTRWGWGNNAYGQLGDGTTTARHTPRRLGSATDWQHLTTAGGSTYALRQDGTLWGWGSHVDGPLGKGFTSPYFLPVQLGHATWQSVSTNGDYTLAVRQDGTLWGWGHNERQQLGDSTFTYSAVPRQIGTSQAWQSVYTNTTHSFALRRDGTLWAWGNNTEGALGNGRYSEPYSAGYSSSQFIIMSSQKTPVQIGQQHWQSLSVSSRHTTAIQRDGTLWQWGLLYSGDMAQKTTSSPYRWDAASWHAVATGFSHTLAIYVDGTLWAWGDNEAGQLGDSTLPHRQWSPKRIGPAATWVSVATAYEYSIGLQADGSIWAWGDNTYGQLGDGTTLRRRVPVRLPNSR